MSDLDVEREIRATFRRRGVDIVDPGAVPPAREVVRHARRRQLATIVTAALVAAAVVAASVVGVGALIRSSERHVPAEPPFSKGSLRAVASQPVSFEGLVADTDGNLWSSGPGLTRFDLASGSFRTFTVADDPAFGGIGVVVPAREGGVWVLSRDEETIRRFEGERLVETVGGAPRGFAEGPDGTIWGSGTGVHSWTDGSWVEAPSGRPTTETDDIAVDTAGNVWVENLRFPGPEFFGVSRFDGVRWITWTTQEVFRFDDVSSSDPDRGYVGTIVPGLDGDVWVGGRGGVAHFVDGTWTSYGSGALGLAYVESIAVTDGEVWIGGSAPEGSPPAIARFDGTTWTRVVEGLDGQRPRSQATQVVATPQAIWAVTGNPLFSPNATLYRLDDSRWQPIVANARPANVSYEIAAAGPDELWTGDLGAWRLQGDQWTHFDESDGDGGHVNDLAVTGDGTVWVATKEGLASFDGTRWELVAPGAHTAIALGPGGEVWTASRDAEDWTVRPVRGSGVPALVGLTTTVSSLAVGPAGDVWAGSGAVWGTGGGLAHFDGQSWRRVEPVAGRHSFVEDVEATPDGDVWVLAAISAVDEQGITGAKPYVARYHDGGWTTLGEGDGTPLDARQLEVTPDGHLLLLGSEGLFVLRDGAWRLVQEGGFTTLSIAPDDTVWLGSRLDGLFRLPNALH